jgi:hypothetical protein
MEDRKREVLEKRKYKTVVIGDKYARGCASELTYNLGNTFEVTGYVRLGTWQKRRLMEGMGRRK